jgi:O-antigen ligase
MIHVAGYFFADNKAEALTAIEIKLCFLAFPLLIYSSSYENLQVKKVFISFVSGSVLVCLFYLFRAGFLYFFNDVNAFYYTEFSFFMHPGYFSMYLVFAQLIVIMFYPAWLRHLSNLNVKIGFISMLFITCIFLCSSKMGLLSALLLIPITISILLFRLGYKKFIVFFASAVLLTIMFSYQFFPKPFERITQAVRVTSSAKSIDKADGESTAVRILIWRESLKLIKENFIFGTSPGDANDALVQAYTNEGMTGALEKKLNAHNQFLQTFIGTGLIGFILLGLFTFGAFIYAIIKKNFALSLFSILIILNFLIESMLQAQAGFLFFVFFFCFLTRYNVHKLNTEA